VAVASGLCALLDFGGATQLAVTPTMLIAGPATFLRMPRRRYRPQVVAVNLSTSPCRRRAALLFPLACVPAAEKPWLDAFSGALLHWPTIFLACSPVAHDANACHKCDRAPLTISIGIRRGAAGLPLTRAGAQIGDDIWCPGTGRRRARLGGARRPERPCCSGCIDRARKAGAPAPRIRLGVALRGIASALHRVSDGLIGDWPRPRALAGWRGAQMGCDPTRPGLQPSPVRSNFVAPCRRRRTMNWPCRAAHKA